MKICTAQTKPIKGNILKNIKAHLDLIELAVKMNTEMIVFPELSISGYEPTLAQELATTSDDSRFDIFQDVCDKNNIVIAIGAPIKKTNGVNIGMILFSPHQNRVTYLKKHLYHTETDYFVSGDSLTNLTINNTNIGLAICYEISVQEHQVTSAENGAELYVAGVVESVDGIDGALNKMSAIAKKYSMITLMSNCIGLSGKYNCAGKSSIWNEKGELIDQLGSSEVGILVYDTKSLEISRRIQRIEICLKENTK